MLSDRSYMRDSYGRQTTSLLTWMICALVAGFILQLVFERLVRFPLYGDLMVLDQAGLTAGYVWKLVTYTLLHDGPLHILGVGLGIYFLGREIVPHVGEKRLLLLCIGSAVLGGLAWFGVHYGRGGTLIGGSAVVYGLLALFACMFPNREMTLLIFFVIPVKIKPKYLALIAGAIDAAFLVISELPGATMRTGVAHSAHLGGMIAGLLYFQFVYQREWRTPDGLTEIELPRWLRRSPKNSAAPAPKYKVNLVDRQSLRAEVDRILDKINSEGFGALTDEEKRILDEAKDTISRR